MKFEDVKPGIMVMASANSTYYKVGSVVEIGKNDGFQEPRVRVMWPNKFRTWLKVSALSLPPEGNTKTYFKKSEVNSIR